MAEDLPGGEEKHEVVFSRNLFIEQEDFMEVKPNNKYFRLSVGGEVRLKNAYIIKCESVVKDGQGNITEVLCTYDPDSSTGGPTAGRKVKGTLHWAEEKTALPATVRLYDYLIDEQGELNTDSLTILNHALVEPFAGKARGRGRFQFIRQGYFTIDELDSEPGTLVFNQIVVLKDSFAKTLKS
jgi:glutaminyl-tRNA synthetase